MYSIIDLTKLDLGLAHVSGLEAHLNSYSPGVCKVFNHRSIAVTASVIYSFNLEQQYRNHNMADLGAISCPVDAEGIVPDSDVETNENGGAQRKGLDKCVMGAP